MISWIRIESIVFCWLIHFFLLHKFSDRKIVHGVLVTKSEAKHRDGTESPLVISGWIFFYYCSRGEHVAVGFLWKQECLFSFLDSSSVGDSDPQDFLGHPDPDPDLLVRYMDPDPAPDPSLFSLMCWADWNNARQNRILTLNFSKKINF